jgi:L-ribulose-5-phosphate 4-epimerase
MLEELRIAVCRANLELKEHNLVIYTWGNVSGIDHAKGIFAIKPSGVPYDELTADKMVLVDLDGKVVEGSLRPSSDTPTHLELYRSFASVGGITHTHSLWATIWAQACREIPCLGTTHADYFYGPVPVTDRMARKEVEGDYELNTAKVIVRRFRKLDPMRMRAVLVAGHGPFAWGSSAAESVEAAVVLEEVAKMAAGAMGIGAMMTPGIAAKLKPIPRYLLDKHYLRKHGKNSYYGQK